MKIGIDIDDTISLTNEKIIQVALKYDKDFVKGRGFKDKNSYSFMEMFYWSVLDVDGFLDFLHGKGASFYAELEPMPGAVDAINKLALDGNEIILITRRKNSFKVRSLTKKWLKMQGIKYNKLVMGCETKGEICKKLNISLFIDNDKKNVQEALDNDIMALLMTDDYNKGETSLHRVNNWDEVLKYVDEVTKDG